MASSEPARGNDCRKLVNRSRLTSFRGRLLESPRRSTSWLGSSVIRPRLAMQPSSPTRGSRRSKMTSSTRRSPRPPSGSDSRPSPWRRPILTWKSFSPVRDPPCSSFPVQAHHDFWCSFAEPEEASRTQHCHKTLPNNKLAPSSAATHRTDRDDSLHYPWGNPRTLWWNHPANAYWGDQLFSGRSRPECNIAAFEIVSESDG